MFLPLEFDPLTLDLSESILLPGCVTRPDARALNEIWLGCKLSCVEGVSSGSGH